MQIRRMLSRLFRCLAILARMAAVLVFPNALLFGQEVITTIVSQQPGAVFKSNRLTGDIEGVLDRMHASRVLEEDGQFVRVELAGWDGRTWSGWVPKSSVDTRLELDGVAIKRWKNALEAEERAKVLAADGQFAMAAAEMQEPSQTLHEVFGRAHVETIRYKLSWAVRLIDADRLDNALKVIEEIVPLLREMQPRDEERLAYASLLRATLEYRRGNSDVALEHYREAFREHAQLAPRYSRIGKRWLNHSDNEATFNLLGLPGILPQVPDDEQWTIREYRDFLWPHSAAGDLAVIELNGVEAKSGRMRVGLLSRGEVYRILSVRLPWLLLEAKPPRLANSGWVHRDSVTLLPGGRQRDRPVEMTPPLPTEGLAVVVDNTAKMTLERVDKGVEQLEVPREFSRTLLAETEDGKMWIRIPYAGRMCYASLPADSCGKEQVPTKQLDHENTDVFQMNGHGQPAIVAVSEAAVLGGDKVVARIGFGQEVAVVMFKGDEVVVECEDEDGRVITGSVSKRVLNPYRFLPESGAFLAREITVGTELVPRGLVRKIQGVEDGALIVDTLRQPRVNLSNPPLLPLTLGRVHFARLERESPGDSGTLVARGIFFGETPPHMIDMLGISLNQRQMAIDIAIDDLQEGVKGTPRNATAWLFLGVRYADNQDYKNAEAALTKALKINNRNTLAYLRRGMVRQMLGDINGAKNDFEEAIKLDPQNQAAALQLFQLNQLRPN